jgi:hypothetical protein
LEPFAKIHKRKQKRKRERKGKRRKGPGDRFQPAAEDGPRPIPPPSRNGTEYPPPSAADRAGPPVIPSRDTETNTTRPWRDLRENLSDLGSISCPLRHATRLYKPPSAPHLSPKTLANRRQAARARSRSAATVSQEHHRFLVSLDPLSIPLLHLLFFLNLAHLADMVLLHFVTSTSYSPTTGSCCRQAKLRREIAEAPVHLDPADFATVTTSTFYTSW